MVKVNVGQVRLPRKSVFSSFKQGIRNETGAVVVDFMPPVELPIAPESLEQLNNEYRAYAQFYAERNAAPPKKRYLAPVETEDLADLVHAVLAKTLPGFIVGDQYGLNHDSGGLSLKEVRMDGKRLQGWSKSEIRPDSGLYFSVDEFRFPVSELPKQKLSVPEISGVTLTQYATLPKIQAENGGIFLNYLVEPILRALMYDAALMYGKKSADQSIRSEYLDFEIGRLRYHSGSIYIQVTHPSLQRFNEALNEAKSLEGFFEEHMPALREAVTLVHEADLINAQKLKIIRGYSGVEHAYSEAVKKFGELPPVGGITETTSSIDALIAAKLREANEVLAPLMQHVPRGIMSYALQPSAAA